MNTPKYIRVEGQLYRRRDTPKHPKFIRVEGHLYRLAQTGAERDKAIDVGTKVVQLLDNVVPTLPDASKKMVIDGIYNPTKALLQGFTDGKVPKEFGQVVERLKQLAKVVGEMGTEQADAVSKQIATLTNEFSNAGNALSSAELQHGKQEIETPSAGGGGIDWSAVDKPAPQQQQASVEHPLFIRVEGNLYRLA